jgi:hypothetical protein
MNDSSAVSNTWHKQPSVKREIDLSSNARRAAGGYVP